jgi:Leucine-rich repeat (LRR) protein
MIVLPLTHLDLSDFKFIADEAILSLAQAKNLQMLSLSGTMLTDAGSAVLVHMSSLKELSLDRTDIGDKSMEYLRGQFFVCRRGPNLLGQV